MCAFDIKDFIYHSGVSIYKVNKSTATCKAKVDASENKISLFVLPACPLETLEENMKSQYLSVYVDMTRRHKSTLHCILKQSQSFIYNILNCNAKFITSGQFVQ